MEKKAPSKKSGLPFGYGHAIAYGGNIKIGGKKITKKNLEGIVAARAK